jgi:hypothetical protein
MKILNNIGDKNKMYRVYPINPIIGPQGAITEHFKSYLTGIPMIIVSYMSSCM